MPTLDITGNQSAIERNLTTYDVVNCTGATFHVGKPQPDYPLRVSGSPTGSAEVYGGLTLGSLDPAAHRAKPAGLYANFNSAGVFLSGATFDFHDWVFGSDDWRTATGHVWDAIRINGSGINGSVLERVWMRGCRDDAVESDTIASGTLIIDTCLFEGCYAGISCTGDQLSRTISMTNTALMCTNFFEDLGEGAQYRTFGPMFKPDGSGQHGPRFDLRDVVLAYETWDGAAMTLNGQPGTGRVAEAFRRMTCGPDVYMCVLGAGTLPAGYPSLPPGMTLLTGAAAQNRWQTKRAQLIAEIDGDVESGGLVTRNVCSFAPSTRLITIDRRLALPATTITLNARNPGGSDTEVFAVTVS